MRIVQAGDADVRELVRLYGQLSKDYSGDESAIRAALRHPATDVYLAVEGGTTVGTATVSYRAVPSFGLVAHVDDVVVDDAHPRRGIATAMMRHVEARARQRGCRGIDLTSRPDRVAANALYVKLGYEFRETNPYFLRLE